MLHHDEEGYGGLSENKYISIGRQVPFFPSDCVKLHDEEGLDMSGIQLSSSIINSRRMREGDKDEADSRASIEPLIFNSFIV